MARRRATCDMLRQTLPTPSSPPGCRARRRKNGIWKRSSVSPTHQSPATNVGLRRHKYPSSDGLRASEPPCSLVPAPPPATMISSGLALLAVLASAYAAPALEARQSITALSTSKITSFRPFTHYASTAYCQPSATLTWSCGANCQANPTFKPIASGGDGDGTQFCQSLGLLSRVGPILSPTPQGMSGMTPRLRRSSWPTRAPILASCRSKITLL